MLFSIVSVSAVCLALAISGWVPPDPQSSDVTSIGLVIFGQLWRQEDGYATVSSTEGIVKWMVYLLSPLRVTTDKNFENFCSCRPTQEPDGTSLWPLYRKTLVTDVYTGVMWGTIDRLTEDITYGFDLTISNVRNVISPPDDIADDLDNVGNFLVATWRMTGTLPSIHILDVTIGENLYRPHLLIYPGSWIPFLSLLMMVLLRGKKKKVNRHYVYSIKEVQRALARGRRRYGYRAKHFLRLQKPKQENKNWTKDGPSLESAFGHGDFSQTFRVIDGKLVVQKLRENLEQP